MPNDRHRNHRSPADPDVLKARQMPRPEPEAGQVLIRVGAAGVNRPDVLQRKGGYPPPPGAPADAGPRSGGHG